MKYLVLPFAVAISIWIMAFPISSGIAFVFPGIEPVLALVIGIVCGTFLVVGALFALTSGPYRYENPPSRVHQEQVLVEAPQLRRDDRLKGRTVFGDLSIERLSQDPETAKNIAALRARLKE